MLKKSFCILTLMLMFAAPYFAFSEEEKFVFKKNTPISIPSKQARIIIFYDTGNNNAELFRVSIGIKKEEGAESYLNDDFIDDIRKGIDEATEKKKVKREQIKLRWAKEDGSVIYDNFYSFSVDSENENPQVTPANVTASTPVTPAKVARPKPGEGPYDDERTAETEIIMNIGREAQKGRAKNYTIVIFNEDLSFRRVEPLKSSVGDLIYTCVIYTGTRAQNLTVEYSPCSLEPDSPQLLIGDTSSLGSVQAAGEKPQYFVRYFPPRRCFNTSVTITVRDTASLGGGARSGSFSLQQYNRYRGTLQVGVLSTDQHVVDFGLQPVGDKKVIYDKGPTNKGPDYTASLVIYSIPRYLQSIFSKAAHFSGRDIINDQNVVDRLGAVIGVGLNNPGRRFVLGLSFEIAFGINLIGVMDFARLNRLGGSLKAGDEFVGNEQDIPIQQYWAHKFVFGLSLDLRYITALFSKR